MVQNILYLELYVFNKWNLFFRRIFSDGFQCKCHFCKVDRKWQNFDNSDKERSYSAHFWSLYFFFNLLSKYFCYQNCVWILEYCLTSAENINYWGLLDKGNTFRIINLWKKNNYLFSCYLLLLLSLFEIFPNF